MDTKTDDLKMFKIEDGETHWLVSTSEAAARQCLVDEYCFHPENIEAIEELPMDTELLVYLDDGYREDERHLYPTEPYQDETRQGSWFCKATIQEWLTVSKSGDYVASSIF